MGRSDHTVGVVIAAAGKGLRMGSSTPKQFLRIGRRTLIEIVISVFDANPSIQEIVIVAPAGHRARVEKIVQEGKFEKVSAVVIGGRERQESVRRGLEAFRETPAIVLVHDAARPLVDRRTIDEVIRGTRRFGAALAATPVKDTMKREGHKGYSTRTIPRSKLWAAQTPQGFRFELLMKAHKSARKARFLGTDEASLVERLRVRVRFVEGSEKNIKITTPGDLLLARMLLRKKAKGRP